jgi:hypothetical protein
MVQEYDRSLGFSMSRFFWVKGDDTDPTYEYNAFMTQKGSILLLRTTKTGTDGLYWIGQGVFNTVWSDRAAKTYVLPSLLRDQAFDVE